MSKTIGIAVLLVVGFSGVLLTGHHMGYWHVGGHSCCGNDPQCAIDPRSEAVADQSTLPPADDAALIAAQVYCPIMPESKLGEMGQPVKIMVKDKAGIEQPVFVCCKGCKRKVLANQEAALAKVAEFKAAAAGK